jgi:hypothetical protein
MASAQKIVATDGKRLVNNIEFDSYAVLIGKGEPAT